MKYTVSVVTEVVSIYHVEADDVSSARKTATRLSQDKAEPVDTWKVRQYAETEVEEGWI